MTKPVVLLASLLLALGGQAATVSAAEPETAMEAPKATKVPLDELRTFAEIFERIKADYVEDVSDKTLLENAIRGMVNSLDPHSNYLNAEEFNELRIGTTGEFGGLGIEVGMEDGFLKIVTPLDDTPAQRAGIRPGDVIIKLDGKHTKGMSLEDSVKILRGEPGTSVTLTILREGEDAPLEFTLTRDIINVTSVRARTLEPGYGYVRITQFQSNTGKQLEKALTALEKESPLKGIVLDLRNNPGGVLDSAIDVADAFLEDGLIVYTEGRIEDSNSRFSAKPGDMLNGAPIALLINGGSASASEIVAGALKDHERALVVGERSFGKGSVQTIQALGNGSAIKITTARYFTPNGHSIQAQGILPDIEVGDLSLTSTKAPTVGDVKEADLSGHLENEQRPAEPSHRASMKLAQSDYQLFEALNLLKGMAILKHH